MNPGGKMKPGQRWWYVSGGSGRDGDYFDVIHVNGLSASIRWEDGKLRYVDNKPDVWHNVYRLDEIHQVKSIMKAYESLG